MKKIFGTKRKDVTGDWRKLHIVELYNVYSSSSVIGGDQIKGMRWAGHLADVCGGGGGGFFGG